MKTFLALILFTAGVATAADQIGDGLAAERTKFVGRVANKCPSSGELGSVNCPKAAATSPALRTHVIRYVIPKCAPGFADTAENLMWNPMANQGAKDVEAHCAPPAPTATFCTYTYGPPTACQPDGKQYMEVISALPDGCLGVPFLRNTQACVYSPPPVPAPPCVPALSGWSAPDARGVQTASVVTMSPLPCQVNAAPVTARCAPRAAVLTPLDPRFQGSGVSLPTCAYAYLAYGMCNNGVRTRAFMTTGTAMCGGGVQDTCQACNATDTYAECLANPTDESYDCDFRGVCTVKRVARDCSTFKVVP